MPLGNLCLYIFQTNLYQTAIIDLYVLKYYKIWMIDNVIDFYRYHSVTLRLPIIK